MNKKIIFFIILGAIFILSVVLSLLFGAVNFTFKGIIQALFNPNTESVIQTILWQIRIPRIILGIFVGAGLAACGATFQGILRNPLAESYTLGVSGGAALGATIGIILGSQGLHLSLFAFLGSLLSISLVYIVASKKHFSNTTLILGGVILSFLFSSLVLLILAISSSDKVHSAILWLMGDLSSTPNSLILTLPFIIIPAIVLLIVFGRDINIMTLGDEKATHLGLNVGLTKKLLFAVASFITAVCVSYAGIIGFVGLIIPHFMRFIFGPDHRINIMTSAIAGAGFLILSDTIARSVIRPVELPVGVITGILGGAFFLIVLLRSKKWEIF